MGYTLTMPARNAIKTYVEGGYYHLYNRGVEKRLIFLDAQEYLSPKNERDLERALENAGISPKERKSLLRSLQLRNYSADITLLAFCLRPNHFHFFIKQNRTVAIDDFMHSLCSRYSAFFNRKYQRSGTLYQGVYKAVLIEDEAQYLHISRYIHKQAISAAGYDSRSDERSSYPEYLEVRKTAWIHPEEILAFFSPEDPQFSYERFVAEYNPLDDLEDSASVI
jgi:putative transposase